MFFWKSFYFGGNLDPNKIRKKYMEKVGRGYGELV